MNHRALIRALAAAGEYTSAADARTVHLRAEADRLYSMWGSAHGPHRDRFQVDYAAAQQRLTAWLVGVDEDARAEVEALLARWAKEAAA